MELDILQPQEQPADDATEVGSYFVANYPPFSIWSPEHVPACVAALDRTRPSLAPSDGRQGEVTDPLGLYLHIPFCRKRCHFCYFRVYTDKNSSDVDTYLHALAKEAALYADRAALADREFDFVYFGGGTPSFLSSEQLQRLIDRISEHWQWDHAREVTFECEPGTLKKGKLETIKSIGVTRLSLGVEHFDDDILAQGGRAHRSPEILQAWEWIREVGFPQVNIDLIAGMMGETDDKWRDTVDKALAMDADSVTIYQMEVPHNTTVAREAKQAGVPTPVATWKQKRAWTDYAFRQFEAAGYEVSSAYTLVKPKRNKGFVYRDALWHGADLVAMGVASFGHIGGVHYQNADRWEEYTGRLLEGNELPLARALPITDHQRLIREMILQLKLGRLDGAYFLKKFGVHIGNVFAEGFASLVAEGMATVDTDNVRLTREGLLRVDELLPRFYEPGFRNVRYT